MEKNTNEENKTQSVALHLETLTASYDKLLKEYNQMQADYIDYLNEADESKKEFLNMKGRAFWGKGKAGNEVMTNDINECEALCAENKNCTGATFDDGENTCYLRSGMSSTVAAADNYYAIISKKIFFLSRMKYMNSKLEQINKEILDLVKQKADPVYEKATVERKENQDFLASNYIKLMAAEEATKRELAEHTRLQDEDDNGAIQLKSNYTMFIIMFVIAIIGIIILVKFSIPSSNSQVGTANLMGGASLMGGVLKKKTYYLIILMLLLAGFIYFTGK